MEKETRISRLTIIWSDFRQHKRRSSQILSRRAGQRAQRRHDAQFRLRLACDCASVTLRGRAPPYRPSVRLSLASASTKRARKFEKPRPLALYFRSCRRARARRIRKQIGVYLYTKCATRALRDGYINDRGKIVGQESASTLGVVPKEPRTRARVHIRERS